MTGIALSAFACGVALTLAIDAGHARRAGWALGFGLAAATAGGLTWAGLDGWRVDAYRLGEIATVRLLPPEPAAPRLPKASERIRVPEDRR